MTRGRTSPDRWERIEALFHQASALEPGDRSSFLREQCADDTGLRRDVERLLEHDEAGEAFLDRPPWKPAITSVASIVADESDPVATPGAEVGRYRLLEPIASGGMGTVWRAERIDGQFERHVAIKLIKRGMDTDEILHRFRNERQLLANFAHPNIARLLDGGATADGRPYLVMEFIDGVPIDRYCAEHGLSIPDRLRLFRRVCAAVHEAHKNLIVHRDLKPSNILVTAEGEPKLLDFGIAKVLSPGASDRAVMTATGLRMLTPRYASPEQIQGRPITTESDVYSLGVILYELLTGCRPYQVTTDSRHELERAVLTHEPTRPSIIITRASDTAACGAPELSRSRLRRTLAGDLDTIVLTAMRKEPNRRYGSAEELASDIARHLRNDPIAARPDTWRYRTSKFVKRNRTGVVAAAALCAVVAAGLATTWVLYTRAERARTIAAGERDAAEWNLYSASIAAADGSLSKAYFPRKAAKHLDQAPERFRGWEWRYLRAQIDRTLVPIVQDPDSMRKIRVAWQPGGTLLACGEGHAASSLRIYDGRTGERVQDLGQIHRSRVNGVEFSPDGSRLATISWTGELTMWRAASPGLEFQYRHQFAFPTRSFRFTADGGSIMVIGLDGVLRCFAVGTDGPAQRWSLDTGCGEGFAISSMNRSTEVAVATGEHLMIVDSGTGRMLRRTEVGDRPSPIRVVGEEYVMGQIGDNITRWDFRTLEVISTGSVRAEGSITKLTLHPDPGLIGFQPSRRHHFVLGSLDDATIETEYRGFREYSIVMDLDFSDDGERAASSAWEYMLESWDVSGTPCARPIGEWLQPEPPGEERFSALDTLADGSLLVAGSAAGVTLWEPRTGILLRRWDAHERKPVICVRFHPDGRWIASKTADGVLEVWDTRTAQRMWMSAGMHTRADSIDVSADGRYLACVRDHEDGDRAQIVDSRTGEVVRTFETGHHGAWSLAFSPDGRQLACGTFGGPERDSRVVIWDAASGDIVQNLIGFRWTIETIAWSPSGRTIAVGGNRGYACYWRLDEPDTLRSAEFEEGVWRIYGLKFTPDGKRLLIANSSTSIRFWDLEHEQEIFRLDPVSEAREIVMPQDQRWIACAGKWAIRMWYTATPRERVVGEVLRRRHDETPGDWDAIRARIERDRWLLDDQRAEALTLIEFMRLFAAPPPGSPPQSPAIDAPAGR